MVLLQVSFFLLQVTCFECSAASRKAANSKKVAASGEAASDFAANDLNLGGPHKLGRCNRICCKCPYTKTKVLKFVKKSIKFGFSKFQNFNLA